MITRSHCRTEVTSDGDTNVGVFSAAKPLKVRAIIPCPLDGDVFVP